MARNFGGRGSGALLLDERLDQAAREARREQGLAAGDDADGREQVGRVDVLEQEPRRAGAQRLISQGYLPPSAEPGGPA